MKIIPAIIADTFQELQKKLKRVEPYADWVQIDVVDGVFAPRKTWNAPEELKMMETGVSLEAHLMIVSPQKHLGAWVVSGVKRVIVPVDANTGADVVRVMQQMCLRERVEFGVALNPNVSVENVAAIIPLATTVLVLAVSPGFSGQQFQPQALEKIKELRRKFPDATIEVDGGINAQTAKQCRQVGADALISASYIFGSANIEEAMERLQNV